jgi:DNA-binding Xre family transcriptional regulator
MINNKQIRKAMIENDIRQWELAEKLGIADSSLSRKFRQELFEEEKNRILAIIEAMGKGD